MCADDAAELFAAEAVHFAFPEVTALFDIFAQHLIGGACVPQKDRLFIVDAAQADLFDQEIVCLFGTPRLAEKNNVSVLHGHNGLDVEHTAGEGSGTGNSSAFFQILQSVKARQQADFIPLAHKVLCQFIQPHSLIGALLGVFSQDAGADRNIAAVDNAHVGKILRSDQGALEGAGQSGGDSDHDRFLAGIAQLFENLGKGVRRRLACLGQHAAGLQHFVKVLLAESDTVAVISFPEGDRERNDGKSTGIRRVGVYCGICNNTNGHLSFLSLIPFSF